MAFRKGSDAAAAVDEAFDALKADGTMQALADKYDQMCIRDSLQSVLPRCHCPDH